MNIVTASRYCAECGKEEGGVSSLKACTSCKLVKYCDATCQRNHWKKHKKQCKQRAAELRDEALFKDPPPKEDCPICFLPMPFRFISCTILPPATVSSVPIKDFADANEGLADKDTDEYYPCCGKSICGGCVYSFQKSRNNLASPFCNSSDNCPFCKTDRTDKTNEVAVDGIMRRAEANDAGAMYALASYYHHGRGGVLKDYARAMELYTRAAELGSSQAHYNLGIEYRQRGDSNKAKFHYETAAMAGHELARCNLGNMDGKSGNIERAFKHWMIAASAGDFGAMYNLLAALWNGHISRESIDSTLEAYNSCCVKMRSEARDACIRMFMDRNKQHWSKA
jgi:tetratricopeptide (TPR) repeat protein